MNNAMYPQYGCLRMAQTGRAFGDFWLEDEEIEGIYENGRIWWVAIK